MAVNVASAVYVAVCVAERDLFGMQTCVGTVMFVLWMFRVALVLLEGLEYSTGECKDDLVQALLVSARVALVVCMACVSFDRLGAADALKVQMIVAA